MSQAESHAPMVSGEFRARLTPPPPPPTPPPAPVDPLSAQETIEVQARTIRHLLANYEALLRKVERDHRKPPEFKIEWTLGDATNFAAQDKIPDGWWMASVTMLVDFDDHQGGWSMGTIDPNDVIFSSGTTRANAAIIGARQIFSKIVKEKREDENGEA